jgi:DNA-directed RNA polymerase
MESFEQTAAQFDPMIHKIMNSLNIYKNRDEFYQLGVITLWNVWKDHDPKKGPFISYAYGFVKGKMMNELTKQANHKARFVYPKEEFWEAIEEVVEESQEFSTTDLLHDLLKSCRTLSENQRKWLKYTLCDQLTVREIADKEQVSLSAVKNWRQGAREKLKLIYDNSGKLSTLIS